jgi:hypothetical protein
MTHARPIRRTLRLAAVAALVAASPASSALAEWTHERTLASLMARDEPVRLVTSQAEYSVYVPLPERLAVDAAELTIELTNSIALLEERSLLRIGINGRVVAQIRLSPREPAVTAEVPIPVKLLEPGFNRLTFAVAQHYTLECEDPAAPELWTEIDTRHTVLRLDAKPRAPSMHLSTLDEIFDRRAWEEPSLTILTADETLDDDELTWGALVAQGAALRYAYVPLEVVARPARTRAGAATSELGGALDPSQLAGRDAVIVGTADELAPLLGAAWRRNVYGPTLQITKAPSHPTRALIVISGLDHDDVTLAARAFAHPEAVMPDAPRVDVRDLDLPSLAKHSAPLSIHEGQKLPLSHFGFRTVSLRGMNAQRAPVEVRVAPDLFAGADRDVTIELHMAHGAGMRRDSVLNVFLNGTFENVIHLDREQGAVFREYALTIPLRSFHAGSNQLTFEPRMMPLVTGDCQAVQDENLLVTIYDDSTIEMPSAGHRARMPDLSLLASTGFPFTADPSGGRVAARVLDRSHATASAAWTILGRLAQQAHWPLHDVQLVHGTTDPKRDVLVVGAVDDLPDDLAQAAPVVFGEGRTQSRFETLVSAGGGRSVLDRLWDKVRVEDSHPVSPRRERAQLAHDGGLGDVGVLMQYESPHDDGRTVVAVLGPDREALPATVSRLVKPDVWGALTDDTVLWTASEDARFRTHRLGSDYLVGDASLPVRASFLFTIRPWIAVVALLIVVTLLTAVSRALLRRFRARHHGAADA